ncbi:E3 ubiquitin-protein ligase NEURL3-like [Centroberyx affinis]|uniref:E3 ubiquitin-protein ligase NEURL3-like n=1 Tax=Centroberyx affinis TaxID=166261 RepID=UPI003A5C0363
MLTEKVHRTSGLERSHRCGMFCLGPLTLHDQAVGELVSLSQGGRRAERTECTFKNGLVFSSRPVKVNERLRLRVEKCLPNWHGALRLGFTNIPPTARALPLPVMAIPDLTDTPGHWAAPVPETCCYVGSELEFWVSNGGNIYCRMDNGRKYKLQSGVDLSQPLWAMIDVYGQTCSILLLGSEKKQLSGMRKSCPAPKQFPSPDIDSHCNLNHIHNVYSRSGSLSDNNDNHMSHLTTELPPDSETVKDCVVCMGEEASITLVCGHQCLCSHCADRVIQEFGTCPLCRQDI